MISTLRAVARQRLVMTGHDRHKPPDPDRYVPGVCRFLEGLAWRVRLACWPL